jgi:hypothetical protein
MSSGDGKGGGSLVENLLALLLSGKLSETIGVNPMATTVDPRAETLRSELRRSVQSAVPGSAPNAGNGAGGA